MSTPIRVLMVVKGLGRGGTERLLASGLAHLDRDRFEAEVAYILPWKDALVPELEALGFPVHCLGGGPLGRVAWVARMRRLARRGRFDIVHTHMPYPAAVARLSLFPSSVALIHTEHNMWDRYRWATYWANALTYNRNAAVLAVSEGVAASIKPPRLALGRRRPETHVVIHGIDSDAVRQGPQARAAARQALGLRDDDIVVGTVGNFTPKKDQGSLLEAVSFLALDHTRLRLVLVGSGPLEGALRDRAVELGIAGRIVWAGSRDDVPDLLPAFDLFVLSSRHEGLSISLLEAMSAGLPCVATRVGGIPEVVDDGLDGLLVEPGDPAALAAAINKLLADPGLMSTLAAEAAVSGRRFELSAGVSKIQDIYELVLARR